MFFLVPNKMKYQFIGVDKSVNAMKGIFFNPSLEGMPNLAPQGVRRQDKFYLDIWNELGLVIDFLKESTIQRVFAAAQNDIYSAFLNFDSLWSASCADSLNFAEVIYHCLLYAAGTSSLANLR